MTKRFAFALIAGAFALAAAGCGHTEEPTKAAADNNIPPVAVKALTVSLSEWPSVYEATGTVRAQTAAVISAKVMGYVRQVNVAVGDRVRAGQPLIVLDSRDLEAAFNQAEAARNEARSAQPEVENAVAAARASLELAQATFRRMQDLLSKDSISRQEFDEAQAKVRMAEANYQMALSRRTQLASKIAQAEAGYRAAQVNRSYAEIAAPFAGVVTSKSADPGALAAPGAPLLTIEKQGAYRLEAAVEESKLPLIRLGQRVNVKLDALGRSFAGRVSEIVPSVDASTRSFIVKIDLPPTPDLRSGLYGRAQFELGKRQTMLIPAAAVTERGQLVSVMVVENGAAHTRLITLGEKRDGSVEVLSGLNAGEQVVYPVPANLSDGAKVEVRS